MGRRLRTEYLKEWKRKKALEDPEYFNVASKKAAQKRNELLKSNPDLAREVARKASINRRKSRKIDPRLHLLADARKRAKAKNLEYNLTKDDIIIPSICPVLGLKLEVGDGKRQANSPSIDRIDNSKGYIVGNVALLV